jgi:2-(1,2-epoxy-1,2-dihydrophenyl)acetyl-CoA isomerase
MSEKEFTAERDGAVLVVTLDHQPRGNALSGAAAAALADLIDEASLCAGAVRAVLIQAAGKQFCTGADVSGRSAAGAGAGSDERPISGHMIRSLASTHHRCVASVFNCRVPVVAAVQGAAQGFGLHLALAADFVVAGELASFNDPFTDRGFSVDSGGSWLLPRLIGLTRAKQFLYLAERLEPQEALAWGLIHRVVGHDDLAPAARDLADRLAAGPTQALAATKRLLNDSGTYQLEQAMHAESMAVELTIRSADFKEGMQAFFQKRPPDFTGS